MSRMCPWYLQGRDCLNINGSQRLAIRSEQLNRKMMGRRHLTKQTLTENASNEKKYRVNAVLLMNGKNIEKHQISLRFLLTKRSLKNIIVKI